jgi:AraC-like DNA-binding protein
MDKIVVVTYRAPRGRDPVPRTIGEGLQDIEIITGGRGWFEREGHLVEAVRGTVLWHVAGQQTIYLNDHENPYECTFVRFPWNGEADGAVPRISRWKDPVACLAFADEILSAFHGENPDLESLAGYAWHTLRWHALRGAPTAQGESFPAGVRQVQRLIEDQFREDLSMAELAARAGMSVPHLHALFRIHVGQTPHQTLINRRLAEARRLLVATRKAVKEIAFEVGYPDVVTFCKVFRSRCGTSPARYREQYIH